MDVRAENLKRLEKLVTAALNDISTGHILSGCYALNYASKFAKRLARQEMKNLLGLKAVNSAAAPSRAETE